MLLPVFLVLVTVGSSPSLGGSDDWPQWGGPQRNGISAESHWEARGALEPVWRKRIGLGYSSVAVVGKRLYTLGFERETESDVVYCLDALTGETLWEQGYPAKIMDLYHGGGTLTTPAVADGRVYVSEREGWLHCLSAESGEILWARNASRDFGLDVPQWGFAGSPVLLGERIFLNYGRVFALARETGEPIWRTKKSYGDAYSTPAELTWGDEPALAVFAGTGLVVISQRDGSELGFSPWKTKYDVNAMTPVVLGRRVFISSGYDSGCALVDFGAGEPRVVWQSKVMRSQMSGALAWKDHLYGFDESVLKCIDLEGKELWRERGLGQGALSIADGRLIVMGERGELVVAEASPEAYRELARAKVLDGGPCWTMPVLSNGLIYVRNHDGELAAIDHRPH